MPYVFIAYRAGQLATTCNVVLAEVVIEVRTTSVIFSSHGVIAIKLYWLYDIPDIRRLIIAIPLTNRSIAVTVTTTIIPTIITTFRLNVPASTLSTNSPLTSIIRVTIRYFLNSYVTLCMSFIPIRTYGVNSKDIMGFVSSRFDVEITVSCTYKGEEATFITLVPVRERVVLCTINSFLTVGVPDSKFAITLTLNKILRAISGYEVGGCCSNNAREEQRQESCNFFHLVLLKYMVIKSCVCCCGQCVNKE